MSNRISTIKALVKGGYLDESRLTKGRMTTDEYDDIVETAYQVFPIVADLIEIAELAARLRHVQTLSATDYLNYDRQLYNKLKKVILPAGK